MDQETDKQLSALLRLAQNGDSYAYSEFLERVSLELKPYLYAKVGANMADDALQEILVSIHSARHTFLPSRPLAPWLFAIAHRRVTDLLRSQRRFERKRDAFAMEETLKVSSAENKLGDALLELGERDRNIVSKLKLEGYSVNEVADQLSLSVSAVKVAAHRAYSKLKKILSGGANEL